ncbi:hypothetical protein [Lacticaseibacillus zeae]|uniref:Uncharacterized protein n=1 Tax=Lacticaseibacillus zeae subsp. silagei TaxID=3068307 RepID=A0ABD7ZA31_LACZE|nr:MULTISPECIES: hypothetical protein [Lacticaseibacillus]MDE3316260.1 hypothetical protein [Lacticaseibacillus zeae]OFR98562.1 hypothetical protein HMPREF2861_05930 [Lactobacillus sp. HMSC068F07]WLV83788.1 hypothetical protein LACZS2_000178 [Lacticaseibacillus sp. NCIMB 15475]WLV86544.1 hypothetical protein LACZS1_000178 [Lacticaseibacillus sp. NCIMB 15474]
MNKSMKHICATAALLFLGMILLNQPTSQVQAATTDTPTDEQVLQDYGSSDKGTVIYQDKDITVRSFGNDPTIAKAISDNPKTVTGQLTSSSSASNGNVAPASVGIGASGTAKLYAASSGQLLFWSVLPATGLGYTFVGNIHLAYYSGYRRDREILGQTTFPGEVSGTVSMNKNNGGYASLSGQAVDTEGHLFDVVPDVGTSF